MNILKGILIFIGVYALAALVGIPYLLALKYISFTAWPWIIKLFAALGLTLICLLVFNPNRKKSE